jgi:hypothetical protein
MWVHQQHTGAPKEARHIPHGRCDWSRPDSRQWRTKIREKQRRKQPAKSHPSKKCTQNGCKLTPATHHAHSRPVPDAIMPNHTDGQETPTFEVGEYKQSQALVRQQYAHERGTGEVQGAEWGRSQQLPECNGIRIPDVWQAPSTQMSRKAQRACHAILGPGVQMETCPKISWKSQVLNILWW